MPVRTPRPRGLGPALLQGAWILLALLLQPVCAFADEPPPLPEPDPALDARLAGRSLEIVIRSEEETLDRLRKQLERVQTRSAALEQELNAYKVQLSAHAGLLHLASVPIEDLEAAFFTSREYTENLQASLRETRTGKDESEQALLQADEQIDLNRKQLEEIRAERGRGAAAGALREKLSALLEVLQAKRKVLQKIQSLYAKRALQEADLLEAFQAMSDKLENQLLSQRKRDLFHRSEDHLQALLQKGSLSAEMGRMEERTRRLLTAAFWRVRARTLWRAAPSHLFSTLILFGFLQALALWLRTVCVRFRAAPFAASCPWCVLTVRLFQRSLPLLLTALFLYAYAEVRDIYFSDSLLRLAIELIALWLFARWGLDFLRLRETGDAAHVSGASVLRLRLLLHVLRGTAVAYVAMSYLLGNAGALLLLLRTASGVALLAWNYRFWRQVSREAAERPWLDTPRARVLRHTMASAGTAVPLGMILLDVLGYAKLAEFWILSWGRTLGILFWGALCLASLREWSRQMKAPPAAEESLVPETRRPLLWLLNRVLWMALILLAAVLFFLAWGAKQTFLLDLLRALNRPFTLGSITLQPSGFIYALLALLVTHTLARLWRHVLHHRILGESGMHVGLQESIATLSVYLVWIFGILVSLSILGVSSTSLTVGFGALGVGLGFGLQAIFNNFVSGLILLFERPIQTGDAVEINGVWGVVKKINVRSTVVQTWDNASLIIPNSELVSRQVTNWSFKDMSLRRTIVVGVAYGSDTARVRDTLLEVARANRRVLRKPEPDVIFADFGDSALIFKLRVWTLIRYALVLESDMRYEIDRLFRERNISIAFPQRDVHVFPAGGEALPGPSRARGPGLEAPAPGAGTPPGRN